MKKNPKTVQEKVESYLSAPSYEPMSRTALFKQLKLKTSEKKEATTFIEEKLKSGALESKSYKLYVKKKERKPKKPEGKTLIGTLRMNPRGFGFVVPEERKKYPEDIFIPKHLTANAVDGDLVEVESFPSSKKDKGPEGKVLCITKRGRSHLAGIVQWIDPLGDVHLYSPFLGPGKPIKVPQTKKGLSLGDRVIVHVDDWGGKNRSIQAEVSHVLGSIKNPSIDVKAALEEFSLRDTFPPEVIAEAKSFGRSVQAKDCKGRLDLRKTECLTIDPTTAKDFDDALSITKNRKGHFKLGVHIADVAHYVRPGSALDEEAQKRCNSTYFPGTCVPMLPEALSNNLCSLKPKVTRLSVSVLMTLDADGEVLDSTIKRSVIQSAKRFTYEEAKEVLEGKRRSKYLPTLELLTELCHLLKKKRSERGCIDFALPEVVLDINEKGAPTSYHIVEYDITHQLVEECMLKANEMTAKALGERGLPLIFRTHAEPSPETLLEFYALARSLGFNMPPKPEPKDVQNLFAQAKDSPHAQQLSIAFIRSMKLATYTPENIGHYGLSLEEYCHFTSPIRRYPDLTIQRQLFGELDPQMSLEAIAELCSEKERISFKAEQTVKTLKKLRLLERWHTKEPDRVYECFITKIKPFGLFFEIPPLAIEGFLHVSELKGDYYIYEERQKSFFGRRTHTRFCVGDPIEVSLKNVDLITLETSWQRVFESNESAEEKKSFKKKRRKRRRK